MKGEKGLFTVVHQIKRLSGMPPILQTAYMWICFYSNQEGYCFPSQKLLAENCGVSINAIRKYLLILEKMGLIVRERRYKDNMEISSMYQLVIGVSTGGGGVYQLVGEGIAPDGDGTISTELNINELDVASEDQVDKKEQENKKYKFNKQEWDEYAKEEGFATYCAKQFLERGWKPEYGTDKFTQKISDFMKARNIQYCEKHFLRWKECVDSMTEWWDKKDNMRKKATEKNWLSRMQNQKSFNNIS